MFLRAAPHFGFPSIVADEVTPAELPLELDFGKQVKFFACKNRQVIFSGL